jgi:hypothetical protein
LSVALLFSVVLVIRLPFNPEGFFMDAACDQR